MATPGGRAAYNKDFVNWAREHAICIDPAAPPSPAQLARLGAAVAHKRIAALHCTVPRCAQTDQFHRLLLACLLAWDRTLIGAPLAWVDGERIDRFLRAAGRRAPLHLTGAHAAVNVEFARFLLEHAPAGAAAPGCFGFAPGIDHAGALQEISALVRAAAPVHNNADTMLTNLLNLLTHAPAHAPDDELERIAWMLEWIDLQFAPLTDRLGGERYQRLVHGMTVLHDSLGCTKLAAEPATRADAEALRGHMAQNSVAFVLGELYPERRAVLLTDAWAAPLSASTSAPAPAPARTANSATRAQQDQLHDFVRHTLAPGQVFSVWLLHGGGSAGTKRLTVARNTLNALLARVGGTFVLPLAELDDPRAAPLRDGIGVMQPDNSVLTCCPARDIDAIYFAPRITPPARG